MDDQEFYLFIPERLYSTEGVTKLDCLVYAKIKALKAGCYASHATVAEWCNTTKRSVTRAIKKLKNLGWLKIESGALVPTTGRVANSPDDAGDQTITGDHPVPDRRSNDHRIGDHPVLLAGDHPVPHNIYTNINNTINRSINKEAPTPLSKKTIFNKSTSINKETYFSILADPDLAANDKNFLKTCACEMEDWSNSKGEKRIDWAAALRNWIRKNRRSGHLPTGTKNHKQPKTFARIEQEEREQVRREFLERMKNEA